MNFSTILAFLCLSAQSFSGCHAGGLYGHEDDSQVNMVSNWDFENDLDPDTDWKVTAPDMVRVRRGAKYTGYRGAWIYNRMHGNRDSGVSQTVKLADHADLRRYDNFYLSCFIKFLRNATENTSPKYYIEAKLLYNINYEDSSLNIRKSAGRIKYQFADTWYNQLGGNIHIPPGPRPLSITFWVRVEPIEIPYFLDTFALTAIKPLGSHWRRKLQSQINLVRKTDVRITTRLPAGVNPSDVTVEVRMTKPSFDWGPGLSKYSLAGGDNPDTVEQSLRAYMEKMCTWAVFTSAMGWKSMEPEQYDVQYYSTEKSIEWLMENGFKLRGHSIFWEILENQPPWLLYMWGSDLKSNMWRRLDYMVRHYKGKVTDWDVCNEHLHVHLYETRTYQRDLSLMAEEFSLAHSLDPDANLCINEYGVLRDTSSTSAVANLAFKLRDHLHAPVNCLAAQGHLRFTEEFNLEVFLKRLDIISAVGMPITISEFTVHAPEAERAEIIEQALYALYSRELVGGVTYWGVSDIPGLDFEDDTALLEGEQMTPNLAGEMVEKLLLNTWRSSKNYRPDSDIHKETMSLYHGEYLITVKVNRIEAAKRKITVVPSSEMLSFGVRL